MHPDAVSPGSARILVVDDAAATREILERNLRAEGYEVRTAPGVAEALAVLGREPVDLVVTDLRMPGADGLELVRHIRQHHRWTGVVMVTGFATVGGAVEAMREGAEDYLPKPFSDEELRATVRSTLAKVRLRRELEQPGPAPAPDGIVGRSEPMRRVYRLIARAAEVDAPVLVTGESGTGKELIARAIHYRGRRAGGPFLGVNCAAIPETLMESELFGHTKGSFTGASAARQGFFVAADGGTLFLDEVAELSPIAQAKLLRVLQEGQVQAVGADGPRPVDVRIVAATNKDLGAMAQEGRFREDLFYRLHVLPIDVPPLRERGDDILLLFRHFLGAAAAAQGAAVPRVSDQAAQALARYPWPGNVRELANLAQRLVILADSGEIGATDLPAPMRYSAAPLPAALHRTLREVELAHIRAVLESVNGNKTKAAQILGIDRKSLREKLKAAAPDHA
ncbi:MAG TPA: sigma-54 dependent transcriptional regulator [Phycisphaerales bacterium]|nr:sigma-54 dependent transcriptional regulator [Phycisphaerales bacterium]